MISPTSLQRVLVAVDGSRISKRALLQAAAIAQAFSARLTVAHVAPLREQVEHGAELVEAEDFQVAYDRYAQELLERCKTLPELSGLAVDTTLLRGSPAEALSQAAQAEDVGMVVIGSRGLGEVARVLLGSVSDRLVRSCTKPVLVVH